MDPTAHVRQFVIENFLYGESGRFGDDTPFLEGGIIDSTGVLELVAFLEESFGITVEDDELVPDNFGDLNNIGRYLSGKLNGKAPK